KLSIEITGDGRAGCRGMLTELKSDEVLDLGDSVLYPAVSLRGRVVDTRGRAQPDVRVRLQRWPLDEGQQLGQENNWQGHSAADGTFGPVNWPAHGYCLASTDLRMPADHSDRVQLDGASTVPVEIVVEADEDAPPIKGIVVDEAGRPVAEARVRLQYG